MTLSFMQSCSKDRHCACPTPHASHLDGGGQGLVLCCNGRQCCQKSNDSTMFSTKMTGPSDAALGLCVLQETSSSPIPFPSAQTVVDPEVRQVEVLVRDHWNMCDCRH